VVTLLCVCFHYVCLLPLVCTLQFPSAFEFNSRYLLCLSDHLYSCRFGTLLFNCEKERRETNLKERCASLWTYLEVYNHYCYRNYCHCCTRVGPSIITACGTIAIDARVSLRADAALIELTVPVRCLVGVVILERLQLLPLPPAAVLTCYRYRHTH
jgi:Myotubularin-like phosphatase domain